MSKLAEAFDWLYSEQRKALLDRILVYVSATSFLIHLLMVFSASTLESPPAYIAVAGKNYLSAIYTPFSFILFYEVFMLIVALPRSTTQSIAKQYEIVSLIYIRRFFEDIAELDDIGKLDQLSREVLPVFLDVLAGLLMFLMVSLFVSAARKRWESGLQNEMSAELALFVKQKKTISLLLTFLLAVLAGFSLVTYLAEQFNVIYRGATATLDRNTVFYTSFFSVMIFTDVLIVILSLAVSDKYALVFRNAAFIVSTILIRFSLSTGREYSAVLAITGMLFGLFTLVIYNYHLRVHEGITRLPPSARRRNRHPARATRLRS